MGDSPNPPKPPDYTPLANAQVANAEFSKDIAQQQINLAKDQFSWAQEKYGNDQVILGKVVNSFLDTQQAQLATATSDRARYEQIFQPLEADLIDNVKSQRQYYETTFKPLEQGLVDRSQEAQDYARGITRPAEADLVKDYQTYASDERRDFEMGRAQAEVAAQFDAARQSNLRELESFGINPAATRYAALDIGVRTQEAAQKAAAANAARTQVESTARDLRTQAIQVGQQEQGQANTLSSQALALGAQKEAASNALQSEAINVGRGYPGQIAGQYAGALAAGSGAGGQQLAGTASGASTMGTAPTYAGLGSSYLGQANSGIAGAVGTMGAGYSNAMDYYNAVNKQSTGIGSILGLAAGIGTAFLDEGGAIPGPVPAGASPTGGKALDDVPARLSPGEFVLPKDVVSWKGEEFFQRLIDKSRENKKGAGAKPEMKSALPMAPTYASPGAALPMR